jgi:hypothetical protein
MVIRQGFLEAGKRIFEPPANNHINLIQMSLTRRLPDAAVLVTPAPVRKQAAEKGPYASLRSIDCASTYMSTPPLIDLRAPRLWIFLSSLQDAFRAAESNVWPF